MIHLCSDSFFRTKLSASALLLQSYKCFTAGGKVAGSKPAWCQFFDVYLSSPFYIICYSAPCPETVEELARMKLLVKNVAIIKANLGTWKPTSSTDFPPLGVGGEVQAVHRRRLDPVRHRLGEAPAELRVEACN